MHKACRRNEELSQQVGEQDYPVEFASNSNRQDSGLQAGSSSNQLNEQLIPRPTLSLMSEGTAKSLNQMGASFFESAKNFGWKALDSLSNYEARDVLSKLGEQPSRGTEE